MRLDKYLKVSRIIKRRSVARDFADSERVLINGRIAKPSSEVKVGDVITLQSGQKKSVFEKDAQRKMPQQQRQKICTG